jgi:hypothetical protein
MEKAYLLSVIDFPGDIIDEVFSSPEMALEFVKLQDGEEYSLNKDKDDVLGLNGAICYNIIERMVDAKPTLYFGPQRPNGDIPVHFEAESARMIEVRKQNSS